MSAETIEKFSQISNSGSNYTIQNESEKEEPSYYIGLGFSPHLVVGAFIVWVGVDLDRLDTDIHFEIEKKKRSLNFRYRYSFVSIYRYFFNIEAAYRWYSKKDFMIGLGTSLGMYRYYNDFSLNPHQTFLPTISLEFGKKIFFGKKQNMYFFPRGIITVPYLEEDIWFHTQQLSGIMLDFGIRL